MTTLRIDGSEITDSASLHRVFAETFGFPRDYPATMEAWIDCMSRLDDPNSGPELRLAPGATLTLVIEGADELRQRCPAVWDDLFEGCAQVNWGRASSDQPALLALAYETPSYSDETFGRDLYEALSRHSGGLSTIRRMKYAQIQKLKESSRDEVVKLVPDAPYELKQLMRHQSPDAVAGELVKRAEPSGDIGSILFLMAIL